MSNVKCKIESDGIVSNITSSKIEGKISTNRLVGKITENEIKCTIETNKVKATIEPGPIIITVLPDEYIGDYEVTPATYSDKVLPTKNKSMAKDVTVCKIPQFLISNEQGGKTLIIGEEYYN